MALASKRKELFLDNTILSLVNDAYLMVDGDPAKVEVDTQAYKTAVRLLRGVLDEVMRYRKWSFLRKTIHGHEGENEIGEFLHVLRVFDKWDRGLRQAYHPNFLHNDEYFIWDGKLKTGVLTGSKDIIIEVQVDDFDLGDPHTELPKVFYEICKFGLCAALCKIDQGGFQALAGDREAEYQNKLDDYAKKDMLEVGDSVLYDLPASIYARRGIVL